MARTFGSIGFRQAVFSGFGALALATLFGCSSSEGPSATTADGSVTTDDAPLPDAAPADGPLADGADAATEEAAPFDATPPDAPAGAACGWHGEGRVLDVAANVQVCMPKVVCNAETCPPQLGACVSGTCQYKTGYQGLKTLPEAWATYYCDLPTGGCHGVSQIHFPEETAATVAKNLALKTCFADASGKCVGIVASPPMMVGNSQEAKNPDGSRVGNWGLGMTEASGLCYEIEGPGGSAVVAITDRCGGYCKCAGSGFQECGPCVNAADMATNCSCVGTVPGVYGQCCGLGCGGAVKADCDWCASNNHPHFDLDTATFNHVCGGSAGNGSCKLAKAKFVPCLTAETAWPPGGGGGGSCPANSFACPAGPPSSSQPQIPGTQCCCNWGMTPGADGQCH
jgi:hypothetical protein